MRIRQRLADAISGGEFARLDGAMQLLAAQLVESDWKLERFKEDYGWTKLSDEQKNENRNNVRESCRYAFQRGDPFIKGALRLTGEFCFEQGIDGPVSDDKATQAALDEFWNAPDNQGTLFSTVAQLRASNQLLVDGDYFTILRTAAPVDGVQVDLRTAVRYMPATQVIDIITDPFDLARVLYYKCAVPELEWDEGASAWRAKPDLRIIFYKDIFNTDPANDPLNDKLGARAEENAYLLHTSINSIDAASFGWPEPAVSLPWFNRHKRIAQDQEAISSMTAALMNQIKVSATSAQIGALVNTITARGQDPNQNLPGQANITNEQIEMSINRASSRAGEAETNSRMFRMGGAVGLNLPLHSLADPENANLATARSMDRPMLVHLRAYQSIWIDTYRKMIDFALERMGIVDAQYDIPAPRIARQDISEAGKLIMDANDRGLLTDTQAAASVLDLLGFDDIAQELELRDKEMGAEEEAEVTPLEEEPIEESEW